MSPIVTVIIPTYLDSNKPYLDWCLWSLNLQKVPIEIIIVSDAPTEPDISMVRNHPVKVIRPTERTRFAKKNNVAIQIAHPESKYFLLLNDDAFPTERMILEMLSTYDYIAESYQDGQNIANKVLLGCLSNCDQGLQYNTPFNTRDIVPSKVIGFPPQFDLESLEKNNIRMQDIFLYRPFRNTFVFETPRLFFYNVMIPRAAYEKIGPLDETFQNSCEDFDYCIRAKNLGHKLMITQSTFCFHFSGKTSMKTATENERTEDQSYIMKKHGTFYWRVI